MVTAKLLGTHGKTKASTFNGIFIALLIFSNVIKLNIAKDILRKKENNKGI